MELKFSHCLIAVLAFSSPPVARALLPNGDCSAEDLTCQLDSDNVVGIISGVQGCNSIDILVGPESAQNLAQAWSFKTRLNF